jgi:exosortase/archaeosortase family protein
MNTKEAIEIFARYLILMLAALFNLAIFYIIFTPLTVYPVYWVLHAIEPGTRLLEGNVIFFRGAWAEIIGACVAGSAYYLLLILNLSMPMELKKRLKSLVFLLGCFLVLNILRIAVFIALLAKGFQYFDVTHMTVWYFGSTVLVVALWFVNVWIFKIKEIPIYTDAKTIFWEIKR